MHSFYCARSLIQDDFLLFESDIIYETRAVEALIQTDYPNAILISGKTDSGDEVYVETDDGRIVTITKDLSCIQSAAGELVGISRISHSFYQTIVAEYEKAMQSSMKADYETFTAEVGRCVSLRALKIEDLGWGEIDDERHYQRILTQVLPKLKASDLE